MRKHHKTTQQNQNIRHEQNEKFNREGEIIKQKQSKILEVKNIMNEMKSNNREYQQQTGSSRKNL